MKFIFSAPTSPNYMWPILMKYGVKDFLLSYAVDAGHKDKFKQFDEVLIDSGAFSVWNKGGKIDIDNYRNFCRVCQDLRNDTWHFVNLDVIPKTGATKKEIYECCKQGYENFLFLKEKIHNVLPVHHYGDDYEWAERYLEHTDYIGLSPANDTHDIVKQKYLDYMFSKLPIGVKTHAFGYTSAEGLKKYPFYSVDSISYKSAALFGNVTYYKKSEFDLKTMKIDKFKTWKKLHQYKKNTDQGLVIEALDFSIKSYLDFIADVNKLHEDKDFSYLKSQTTLF